VETALVRVPVAASGAAEVEVFYCEHGSGRPLVAIHGWTLDHRAEQASLEPVFRERDGWRRIYPDLPGHGRTRGPEWVRTHDEMVRIVAAFIDTVVPNQRCTLAGSSYGASLVHCLAAQRWRDIDGIVLTVPPTGDRDLPEHGVRHADRAFVDALAPEEQHQLEFVVWQSVEVLEQIRQRFDTGAALCDRRFLERLAQSPALEMSALPQPLTQPALLVAGRFDHWCGYRHLLDFLDDYPFATYAVLDGAGHGLSVERETLYQALVSDWADRVESTQA